MKLIHEIMKSFIKRDSGTVPSTQHSRPFKRVSLSINENISFFKQTFSDTDDLVIKELNTGNNRGVLIYLDTMVEKDKIQKNVLKPVMQTDRDQFESLLTSNFLKSDNLIKAQEALLHGSCVMLYDGVQEFYMLEVSLSKDRAVMEPSNEQVIQGSHEGFIESLLTNLHLIRKSIKKPRLKHGIFITGRPGSIKNSLGLYEKPGK